MKYELIRKVINKIFPQKPYIKYEHEISFLGNNYEGFFVNTKRLGNNPTVVSVGIGEDISIDIQLHNTFKGTNYLFDSTPKAIKSLESQTLPRSFSTFEIGLSDKCEKRVFNLPKNEDHISGSVFNHQHISEFNSIDVELVNLNEIIKLNRISKIDIFKDGKGRMRRTLKILNDQKYELQAISSNKEECLFVKRVD